MRGDSNPRTLRPGPLIAFFTSFSMTTALFSLLRYTIHSTSNFRGARASSQGNRKVVGMRDIGVPCPIGARQTLVAMQGLPCYYVHRKLERSYGSLWSSHSSFWRKET